MKYIVSLFFLILTRFGVCQEVPAIWAMPDSIRFVEPKFKSIPMNLIVFGESKPPGLIKIDISDSDRQVYLISLFLTNSNGITGWFILPTFYCLEKINVSLSSSPSVYYTELPFENIYKIDTINVIFDFPDSENYNKERYENFEKNSAIEVNLQMILSTFSEDSEREIWNSRHIYFKSNWKKFFHKEIVKTVRRKMKQN